MTNLIIVHENLESDQLFLDSLIKKGNHVVTQTQINDDAKQLTDLLELEGLTEVKQLAFAYHYPGHSSIPFFRDIPTHEVDEYRNPVPPEYHSFSKSLVEILGNLKTKGLETFDILTCSLNDSHFKEEAAKLEEALGINIRYSFNDTGNSVDWILESDGVNIRDIYFNEQISGWNKLLTSAVTLAAIPGVLKKLFKKATKMILTPSQLLTIQYGDISENITNSTSSNLEISLNYSNQNLSYNNTEKTLTLPTTNLEEIKFISLYSLEVLFDDKSIIFDNNYQFYEIVRYGSSFNLLSSKTYTKIRLFRDFWVNENALQISDGIISIDISYDSLQIPDNGYVDIEIQYKDKLSLNSLTKILTIENNKTYTVTITDSWGDGIYASPDIIVYFNELIIKNILEYTLLRNITVNELMYNNSTTAVTLNHPTNYIQLNKHDLFDGNGFEIDLTGVTTEGLFAISTDVTSIDNSPEVKNLGVTNGILSNYGGFIIREEQKYFKVTNCYSTGTISGTGAGGIAGRHAGYAGSCTITNCYNTGIISGINSGGIAGNAAGRNGSCTIQNCYTTNDNITGSSENVTQRNTYGESIEVQSVTATGSLYSINLLKTPSWTNSLLNKVSDTTFKNISGAYIGRSDAINVIPLLQLEDGYTYNTRTIVVGVASEEFKIKWYINQLNELETIKSNQINIEPLPIELITSNIIGTKQFYAQTPINGNVTYTIDGKRVTLKTDGTVVFNGVTFKTGQYIPFGSSDIRAIVGSLIVTINYKIHKALILRIY